MKINGNEQPTMAKENTYHMLRILEILRNESGTLLSIVADFSLPGRNVPSLGSDNIRGTIPLKAGAGPRRTFIVTPSAVDTQYAILNQQVQVALLDSQIVRFFQFEDIEKGVMSNENQ